MPMYNYISYTIGQKHVQYIIPADWLIHWLCTSMKDLRHNNYITRWSATIETHKELFLELKPSLFMLPLILDGLKMEL